MNAAAAILAAGLDHWLGEPPRAHPLVAFGRFAQALEATLNRGGQRRARGALGWLLAVLPPTLATLLLVLIPGWGMLVDVLALYLCLGGTALAEHALVVEKALVRGDLPAAREAVGGIVSRQTDELDETAVATASVESVLENGSDAVFGALFWFCIAGAPGAVAYRLANTLDAMWGYRTERYQAFGWAAARLDDLLNFIPARLTALSYALLGDLKTGLRCWRRQARAWDSPNAGPVMAAGAGALGLRLGGAARYHGEWHQRPVLGEGAVAEAPDIGRAVRLVRRALLLWLIVIGGFDVLA